MILLSLVWFGCAAAPGRPAAPSPALTLASAVARLERDGWREVQCEGGELSGELSLVCTASSGRCRAAVSAVTTGSPLPPPADGAWRHDGELQLEASVEVAGRVDADLSRLLLDTFASDGGAQGTIPPPGRRSLCSPSETP